MSTQNIQVGLIIAALIVIGIGIIHVIFSTPVARFYTDHYRGKELIEELWPNQHVRPSFAKKLGFVIIAIGIWLGLSGLKIV
jgi:hypothetical protein